MKYKSTIVAGTVLIGGGLILGQVFLPVDDVSSITLTNPQVIVWDKPLTDAQWAEDVKNENFDIKSSDVLQQMIINSTNQLNEELKNDRVVTCPECVKYDLSKDFSDRYGLSGKELTNEVDTQYDKLLKSHNWKIEKLQQSIERINHELDLRAKGIVVPDKQDISGTPTKTTDLQKVTSDMIRKIND